MRRQLHSHPATPPAADVRIEARLLRRGSLARIDFAVSGEVGALAIGPPEESARTDGLWRTTCFEAFLQPVGEDAYVELNLAPSSRWAAYQFAARREGMRPADLTPAIEFRRVDAGLRLSARIDLAGPAWRDLAWRVGLTAVIEETGGPISYFALAHPSGKPDFHDSRGFVLDVPA